MTKFEQLYKSIINEQDTITPVEKELEGVIEFRKYALGSKSESLRPFLVQDGKVICRLYYKSDNAFENETLKPYSGQNVKVRGLFYPSQNLLNVTEILD